MHFLGWLEDQPELQITKLIIMDYNNGCLSPVRSVKELIDHFDTKHPVHGKRISKLIVDAFIAYRERQDD